MADRMKDELREPDRSDSPIPIWMVGVVVLLLVVIGVVWYVTSSV